MRDDDGVEIGQRAEHRHLVDPLAARRRMIVEHAHWLQAEHRAPLHLTDDEGAGVAGAGDQATGAGRRGGARAPGGRRSEAARIESRSPATQARVSSQSIAKIERGTCGTASMSTPTVTAPASATLAVDAANASTRTSRLPA